MTDDTPPPSAGSLDARVNRAQVCADVLGRLDTTTTAGDVGVPLETVIEWTIEQTLAELHVTEPDPTPSDDGITGGEPWLVADNRHGVRTLTALPQEAVPTAAVEVVQYLDPHGDPCLVVRHSGDQSWSGWLGMLEAGKVLLTHRFMAG